MIQEKLSRSILNEVTVSDKEKLGNSYKVNRESIKKKGNDYWY